ncbi:hypothetical protein PILCRDRAFT_827501, partial [Piloderma croceum F 1598]
MPSTQYASKRVNITRESNAWPDYVTSAREAAEPQESELRILHNSELEYVVR